MSTFKQQKEVYSLADVIKQESKETQEKSATRMHVNIAY